MIPTIDRAAACGALRTVAAGLRAAADIREQLGGEPEDHARTAAAAIDRAAEVLDIPQARIDALKSAAAVQLVRLVREVVAESERLAEGLASARREITAARSRTVTGRDRLVYFVHVAAVVNTLVWLWVGLGQVCLVGWGRRRMVPRFARPDRRSYRRRSRLWTRSGGQWALR